jgi:phenylacetate-coenzyme A ligase PaaK-like adenylate-forming protein
MREVGALPRLAYGFFELLDAQRRPVTTSGERGGIVGTSFINMAVPFVRYQTGDYATYVSDACHECGRAHPLIAFPGRRCRPRLARGAWRVGPSRTPVQDRRA